MLHDILSHLLVGDLFLIVWLGLSVVMLAAIGYGQRRREAGKP